MHLVLLAFVLIALALFVVWFVNRNLLPRLTPRATPTAIAVRVTRTPSPVRPPSLTPTPEPTEIAALPPPTLPNHPSASFQQGLVLRRNGDYVRAATAFRTVLQENPDPALARQAQFRLGEALYLAADFTNAIPALNAVIAANDRDDLAARAHYFLSDILTQQEQYTSALAHLRAYRQTTRALAGIIDQEIAALLLASGDSAAALAQYDRALLDPTLDAVQRVAILKKIAEVHLARGEPERAAKRLGEAFRLAPDDKTRAEVEYHWGLALWEAGESDAAFEHWRHALANYTQYPGAYLSVVKLVELDAPGRDDNMPSRIPDKMGIVHDSTLELQRGIADYYAGQYTLAIAAFRRHIAAADDNVNPEALYYAALAYQQLGAHDGALRNFNALLNGYPQSPRIADALYGKAVTQTRQGHFEAALATLRQLAQQFPNHARTDDGLWNLAYELEKAENYVQAAAVFEELAMKFPARPLAPASRFKAGLNYYLARNFVRAQAAWKATLANYPASEFADGAAYWLGKLARQQGDDDTAQEFFRQAAQPPRTYYSWRALDALGQSAPPLSYDLAAYAMSDDPNAYAELEKWLASWSGSAVSRQLPAAVLNDPFFRRGVEFAALDRALDARSQFAAVLQRFADDPQALYALALYWRDNNYFSLSIDAAARLAQLSGQTDIQLPRLLRQLLYPTYFADLVVPYAERHGFDPTLFFALIRQESQFNPLSYSSAAARGLTQVIPGTGELIARALNVKNFRQTDLFKPYISIRFGTYYFATVLDLFDGNIHYGLMGYNGGPGNARKWERPDLDVAVERITLPETYLYVRTVYANYRQYAEIYRHRSE